MSMDEKIVARTKHGELTIDQLAEIQPGMARLMDEVSKRYYYCYYAAKGGNWRMAGHQLSQMRSLFKIAKTVRPKYAEDLEAFDREYMEPVAQAVREESLEKFELAFKRGVEGSDYYHDKYGYTYIRFNLPPKPPGHFDTNPPERLRKSAWEKMKPKP